jgi:hypothetical protein
MYLVNQLKGLGEYDAVEGIRRNLRSGGQVSDDSCLRITLGYIKHVAMLHPVSAELAGEGVVADL